MTISDLEQPDLIASVRCTDSDLVVELIDGRRVSAPLWWYPRLLQATPEQRAHFEIGRFGIHWPEIDEAINMELGKFQNGQETAAQVTSRIAPVVNAMLKEGQR